MNHKLIRLIALFIFPSGLFAQQEPIATQFWNTYQYSNPATSGLFSRYNGSALYHNQWTGVTGAPLDVYVSGSARIKAIHGGVGLSYQYDHIGYNDFQTLTASYAFHLQLAPGKRLSVGIAGGVKQGRFVSDYYIPPVTMNDLALPANAYKTVFTANVGIAYADSNFRAGVSVTNVNGPVFRSKSTSSSVERGFWAFAEYDLHMGKVTLTPRISGLTDLSELTFCASVMAMINNRLWFGANYMYINSVGLMIGYDFYGKYRVGYSYDYITNKLSTYTSGTHEIVLAFTWK